MVPEIYLTGPLSVEGAGDPLHGLKTVPIHLIEQCLKCDRLQLSSSLSIPTKNKSNCRETLKENLVCREEPADPLCLPVWLEGFLYLQVTKKPLHESKAAQSWFSKQCLENSNLSKRLQTPLSNEEKLRSEDTSVSREAPAGPLCLPVGLEGCLYVQDIKKPVHDLKTAQPHFRKQGAYCNNLTSSNKNISKEEKQRSKNCIVSGEIPARWHCCPDELEKSLNGQDIKKPLHQSKTAKTHCNKPSPKIDNLRPTSHTLSPNEEKQRCQKTFVSGETPAAQHCLPVELEGSLFVHDIKKPLHESKTPQTPLNKQSQKSINLQSVINTEHSKSEKERSKNNVVSGVAPTGHFCLPVGLERALYIQDIKKPLHALSSAQDRFKKVSLKYDQLLKSSPSANLKKEKRNYKETGLSGGAPGGRHCPPVKLEETLYVQDIKKPLYETRTTQRRINKQSLKCDNLHTKSPGPNFNKEKQRHKDAAVLEASKRLHYPPVRLNESLHVQAIKKPLQESKSAQSRFKQRLNCNKVPPASHTPTSRKEKLWCKDNVFLEEDPAGLYRHNIGLERCIYVQPIKKPLQEPKTAQPWLNKQCLNCDKCLPTPRQFMIRKK